MKGRMLSEALKFGQEQVLKVLMRTKDDTKDNWRCWVSIVGVEQHRLPVAVEASLRGRPRAQKGSTAV